MNRSSVNPEAVGMSETILHAIDDVMANAIDNHIVKGCVTLVARKGHIVQCKAYGQAHEGIPMTTAHGFRIASMSKILGAVALLQLQDKGKLCISDPLSDYFPDLRNPKVAMLDAKNKIIIQPAKRVPTIHDLMTMTSGIANSWGEDAIGAFYANELSVAEVSDLTLPLGMTIGQIADKVAALPLASQPGEKWEYSNLAAVMTGRIVELVSGLRLYDYLKENILEPLGMESTAFFLDSADKDRVADVFESGTMALQDGLDTEGEDTQGPFGEVTVYDNVAGGLISTVSDYFEFAQMLLDGGTRNGKRILSPRAVSLLSTNHIGDKRDSFYDHGWGYMVNVQEDINNTFNYLGNGSYGWHGSWGTVFNIWPEEDVVAIFLSQVCPEGPSWKLQEKFLTVAAAAVNAL